MGINREFKNSVFSYLFGRPGLKVRRLPKELPPPLELTAEDHNPEIVRRSKTLGGYSLI